MHPDRRLILFFFILVFAVLAPPVWPQQLIATVRVGSNPQSSAVNPVTNKIYVANYCGADPNCASNGTVTVIDGATNNALSVNVGFYPVVVAVNPVTNKIYAVNNNCFNFPSRCAGDGTVTVIDGATLTTSSVTVGSYPYGIAVNPTTNKIYVTNVCGNDVTCSSYGGTLTVIDGVTLATATVPVGANPYTPVVNSVTNKIYVPNACGNDPTCASPYGPGTVTIIDGVTNQKTSVNVGILPDALDVNTTTNKIYVANECGADPNCASTATMTVIDGATLATTNVAIGGFYPFALAVNSVTNKIYVPSECFGDLSCQSAPNGTVTVIDGVTLGTSSIPTAAAGAVPDTIVVNAATNRIYIANQCGSDPNCQSDGTVTVIDGATHATTNLSVGNHPYGLALNSTTDRIYVPNIYDNTGSVIDGTPPAALQFVPLSQPCRAVDTRPNPIQGGHFQNFAISGEGACPPLPSAAVYSLNVTVVPQTTLGYLTIWPAGQAQPLVSTMNSTDGRVKADAAIVPAGSGGAVSVYVTDTTDVVIDVNGFFAPVTSSTLAFYPLSPCRVADTRNPNFPPGLGPPSLTGGVESKFPILNATTTCNIPPNGVAAYSLNFTVVPRGTLGYLTVWPTGQIRPTVSTLNDPLGRVIANAAIVVAGSGGEVSAYPTDNTDLVIDINGYFAPAGTGGLSLYGVTPCRALDTRNIGSGQPFTGTLSPPVDVVGTGCAVSSLAQAYAFNATVVPTPAGLGYLTLWPDGSNQPTVSTLNAQDGSLTNNMAIVPAGNQGRVDAYAGNGLTQLILDISSYFAP